MRLIHPIGLILLISISPIHKYRNFLLTTTPVCNEPFQKDYFFLKKFEFKIDNPQEYSYAFTKNTSYALDICLPSDCAGSIVLYDSNRKIVKKQSFNQTLRPSVQYTSTKTDIYYIHLYTNGNAGNTGQMLLSFKD